MNRWPMRRKIIKHLLITIASVALVAVMVGGWAAATYVIGVLGGIVIRWDFEEPSWRSEAALKWQEIAGIWEESAHGWRAIAESRKQP